MTQKTLTNASRLTKNVIASVVCLSGMPFLIREWLCRDKVTMLMYHDAKPAVFRKHLAYLSRHYTLISLDRLVDAIYQSDFSQLPRKSIVITFDDGHAGNFAMLPIFKEFGIRPTLYVCTQIINTHRHFWFKITGQSKRDKARLKKMANSERLARLKRDADFEPEKEFTERQALNLDELTAMAPHVDLQPHTQFHPILPRCTETECEQEILGSKQDLERLLGETCNHFSYPNGDYSAREIEVVKTAGFRSARTTEIGWNTPRTVPYHLKVIPMTDNAGPILFRAELTTIPQRLFRLFAALMSLQFAGLTQNAR